MPVTGRPISTHPDRPRAVPRGLEHLSWLMDRAIRVPGTNITVGLDALLGLLPVGGDFLTGVIQVGIVLVAMLHYRVPKAIAFRMAGNVLLDTVIGAVPVVGDLFDVFFKANTRNMRLLAQVEQDRKQNQAVASRASIAVIVLISVSLLAVLILVLIGFITVISWLFKRSGG